MDLDDGPAGERPSTVSRLVPGTTMTRDELAHARRVADEGRRALDALDTSGPGLTTPMDALVDPLGLSAMVQDIGRAIVPDMDAIRRSVVGELPSVLGALDDAMRATMGGIASEAVRSVHTSMTAGLVETVHAQLALTVTEMLPRVDAFDAVAPALRELSGIAEMTRGVIASSVIQEVAGRALVDMSDLLEVVPPRAMLSDILAASDLARGIDLSNVLPGAFGLPSVSSAARAATAAQRAAAAHVGEDDADEAALQAALECLAEDVDPEAPPTPGQLQALVTLSRLVVDLRPKLAEHFTARGWLVGAATGGGLSALVYLAVAQPALFASLLMVATLAQGTKWVHDVSSGLLLPPSSDDDTD